MSKRKPVLPRIREMQQRVEETFAGLINREAVEAEIRAAEAVIREAEADHGLMGCATEERCALCRAIKRWRKVTGRNRR